MGDLGGLDELSLSLVLARLDDRSLARLQLTCRGLRDFIQRRDAFIWLLKLREEFDFATSDDDRELDYWGLYKRLARQKVPKTVRFVGIYTNGSVDPVPNDDPDDERPGAALVTYWADNAFKEDLSPFCSVKGKNVDIVGVLLNGHRALLGRERSERTYLQQRTRLGQFWMRRLAEVGHRRAEFFGDFMSDQQLRLFFLALLESFEQGHGIGVTLFMEDEDSDGDDAANQLYLEARSLRDRLLAAQRHMGDVIAAAPDDKDIIYDTSLIDGLIDGSRSYRRCVAERFIISRAGELTCPVKAGFVFGTNLGNSKFSSRYGYEDSARANDAVCVGGDVNSREVWLAEMQKSLGALGAYNNVLGLDMVIERCKQGVLPGIEAVFLFVFDEAVGDQGEILQRGTAFIEFERGWRDDAAEDCATGKIEHSWNWSPIGMFVFDTNWSLGIPLMDGTDRLLTFPPDIVPLERIDVKYERHESEEDRDDSGDEDDRDGDRQYFSEISVDLRRRRLLDAVALKLVVQDNRMEEMNDLHEAPNIDLARFIVAGRQLDPDPIATHGYFTRAARAANGDDSDA